MISNGGELTRISFQVLPKQFTGAASLLSWFANANCQIAPAPEFRLRPANPSELGERRRLLERQAGQAASAAQTIRCVGRFAVRQAGVPWSRDIFVHDMRKPLPFATGSADAVYASHFLEHLYREEGQQLMQESFRVLAPAVLCASWCRICRPSFRNIWVNGRSVNYRTAPSNLRQAIC